MTNNILTRTLSSFLHPHAVFSEIFLAILTRPRTSVSVSALLVALGIVWIVLSSARKGRAPPGPAGLPILGNVLQMPRKLQFVRFTEWSQQYGPMFGLNLLGQQVIVLNTYQIAGDLLDRCSHIYNDRPPMIMASEILADGMFMSLMRHGKLLRKMRRATHESFNARVVHKYQRIQSEAISLAMLRTLAQPQSWEHNIEVFTASSIFSSVYGWPALQSESPHVEHIRNIVNHVASAAVPGAFLVDVIPLMRYIPSYLARWKREGLVWHEKTAALFANYYQDAGKQFVEGNLQASFASVLAQDSGRFGLSKKEASWLSAVMVAGGADTTAMAVKNCVLALLYYPDVMYRARSELDVVVGQERAPSFTDKDNLPYIQAVVRETLRWRPVIPLGVPHAATEDHYYKGYFIPKGTIVIGNIWAMNRDPKLYPDYDTFRPERHLDSSGRLESTTLDTHQMGHASFGFGRRVCPGMYFAEQAIFIAIATILFGFDIQPIKDENGNAILPPIDEYGDVGLVGRPAPFQCQFNPRFPDIRIILEGSIDNA